MEQAKLEWSWNGFGTDLSAGVTYGPIIVRLHVREQASYDWRVGWQPLEPDEEPDPMNHRGSFLKVPREGSFDLEAVAPHRLLVAQWLSRHFLPGTGMATLIREMMANEPALSEKQARMKVISEVVDGLVFATDPGFRNTWAAEISATAYVCGAEVAWGHLGGNELPMKGLENHEGLNEEAARMAKEVAREAVKRMDEIRYAVAQNWMDFREMGLVPDFPGKTREEGVNE